MKKYVIIVLLLYVSISSFTQIRSSGVSMEIFSNKSGKILMHLGDDGSIAGSRYLTDEYENGKLYMDGEWYDEAPLRFDIFNNYFELKMSSNIYAIDPVQNFADTVICNSEVFIRRDVDEGPKIKLTYLTVLNEKNGVSFCKLYRMRLDPGRKADGYSDEKPPAYVRNTPKYFIYSERDEAVLSSLKTISEFFDKDSRMIKKYMKENKLKLSREEDLISIIDYLSE